jgi:hypothetical protein
MFAVRQLQMAAPSTETVSMPPMSVIAIPAAEFGRRIKRPRFTPPLREPATVEGRTRLRHRTAQ